MTKKIIIPKSINQIKVLYNICDGFILGLKDLSVNLPCYFTLDEIKNLVSLYSDKEIFISVNKNMHNDDLDNLIFMLKELSKINISGIIFYDISIINFNKKLDLNLNLIWNQEHLVTNYNTINYWNENGVIGSYLSSELTLDEIIEIKKNVSCKIMMNIFGYIPMFTSKRTLVKNYLDKFNLKDDSRINYLEKENNVYPVISENVTTVYSSKILNLIQELTIFNENNIDYLIFNAFNIDDGVFKQIIEIYNDTNKSNSKENFNKINMLLNYNIDTGFLYKETVYKVKKNG